MALRNSLNTTSIDHKKVSNIYDPVSSGFFTDQISHTKETTLIDGATADTTGSSINVLNYKNFTFQYVGSSISTGANLEAQASLDDVNWVTLDTTTVSSDGSQQFTVSNEKWKYMRGAVSNYTDGTFTILHLAGD